MQVRVWDVNTHRCLATLVGHNGAVRALAATDSVVFSGSDDTTIRVRLGRGVGPELMGGPFLQEQWCMFLNKPLQLRGPALKACLDQCHRLPPPTMQAWDANTLTCLRTLEGHEDNVRVLAVGHNNLFSGSWDKTVRVSGQGQASKGLEELCKVLQALRVAESASWGWQQLQRCLLWAPHVGAALEYLAVLDSLLAPPAPTVLLNRLPPGSSRAGVVCRHADMHQGAGGAQRGSAGAGGGRPVHGQRQLRHHHPVRAGGVGVGEHHQQAEGAVHGLGCAATSSLASGRKQRRCAVAGTASLNPAAASRPSTAQLLGPGVVAVCAQGGGA